MLRAILGIAIKAWGKVKLSSQSSSLSEGDELITLRSRAREQAVLDLLDEPNEA